MKEIQKQSTKKIANKLLFAIFVCFALMVPVDFIGDRLFGSNSEITMLLVIILLDGVFLFMFLFGLLIFVRKRNPYTLTEAFLSSTSFSLGRVPQIYGGFVMFVAGSGFVMFTLGLLVGAVRTLLELL